MDNCPYCGSTVSLRDSAIVYGKSYGLMLICDEFPYCDAYVGVHKHNHKPLGRLANKELRYWKKLAHAAFDPIWKEQDISRTDAYAWLAEALGIEPDACHIGMFDVAECREVVRLSGEKYSSLAGGGGESVEKEK